MKIHNLNQKKKEILFRVGDEFRQERLENNMEFFNGNSDRIIMQKVYTGWLQYILDKFIGDKVLKKFQEWQKQKLLANTFGGWRAVAMRGTIATPTTSQKKRVSFIDVDEDTVEIIQAPSIQSNSDYKAQTQMLKSNSLYAETE